MWHDGRYVTATLLPRNTDVGFDLRCWNGAGDGNRIRVLSLGSVRRRLLANCNGLERLVGALCGTAANPSDSLRPRDNRAMRLSRGIEGTTSLAAELRRRTRVSAMISELNVTRR